MEDIKYLSLATTYEVDASFDSERFIKLRLKICHDGKNPNGSTFDAENIQKAEPSISNTPILANTLVDEDEKTVDLGSHDMHYEPHKLKDGEYKLVYDELVVGVVPETNNYEVTLCDGRHYAFCDCYIFKEYSNYFQDYIEENQGSTLSMEIFVDDAYFDKKEHAYRIKTFRYKGITFLGKTKQPGMIGTHAEVSSFESKQKLFNLLSDLKSEIEKYQSSFSEVDINNKTKKEDFDLDEKMKLLEQFKLSKDVLDFDIESLSIDELKVKLESFIASQGETDPKDKFALNGQFMEELIEKLSAEKIESEWGNYSKYCYVDHNGETGEVFCWDRADWKLYGFTYSISGDAVTVDFACKKRKKFDIVDFIDATEDSFTFESAVSDVFAAIASTKDNLLDAVNAEFTEYKDGHMVGNAEVNALREFKASRLSEDHKFAIAEKLSEFEDLAENAEFIALKEKAENYENVEDLERECYIIRGKNAPAKFSAKPNKTTAIKLPIGNHPVDDEPYGGLFSFVTKNDK